LELLNFRQIPLDYHFLPLSSLCLVFKKQRAGEQSFVTSFRWSFLGGHGQWAGTIVLRNWCHILAVESTNNKFNEESGWKTGGHQYGIRNRIL
jgi:hypothetical protein